MHHTSYNTRGIKMTALIYQFILYTTDINFGTHLIKHNEIIIASVRTIVNIRFSLLTSEGARPVFT